MVPKDLIELGVVRGAYGLKGWVRVAPFADDGTVLESVHQWWLLRGSEPQPLVMQSVKRHADSIVAKWEGCDSKEVADAFKGAKVSVPRSEFPQAGEGEHYLADVIGRRVVNRQGVELGTVSGLRSGKTQPHGAAATQWLEVKGRVEPREDGAIGRKPPLLIPLVEQYVDGIEVDTVKVDWEANW